MIIVVLIIVIQHNTILSSGFALEVIDVMLTDKIVVEEIKQKLELFVELDKGIEDMEACRVTPYDEAMKKIAKA